VCDGEALRVSLRLPEDREFLCSNELSPITLLVEGGVPPYTWSLRDSPDFSLVTQGDSEAELELQHTASPSEYLLEAGVSDSCGNDTSGEFTIEVRTTPKLLSAPLPNACATRLYAAPLALTSWMEGVTWAAEGLPRGVQMDASAGLITGTFQEVRDFPLEVTVSNDCGSSAPESRTVHVVEPLAGCPIQPSSSNRFGTLPVPCEGAPYSADIDFLEPVSCSIFERPPGFELTRCRTDGVTLSGTPSGPGNLIISVNDATGTQTVAGFSFEPRRACWFAYVSDDEESALHILDPLLFDEVSGELHARPGVASFAFAPDGRFLAYVAQGDLVRELTVVELATWKERVVPLDGNVFHYAWSQAGFLAVAFGGEGPSQLGGANVAELDWESGAELVALEPVAANVSSDLTWIGDEFVVYLSTDQNVDGRLLSLARRSSAEDASMTCPSCSRRATESSSRIGPRRAAGLSRRPGFASTMSFRPTIRSFGTSCIRTLRTKWWHRAATTRAGPPEARSRRSCRPRAPSIWRFRRRSSECLVERCWHGVVTVSASPAPTTPAWPARASSASSRWATTKSKGTSCRDRRITRSLATISHVGRSRRTALGLGT
jgi:hypothetical protein